MTTYGLVMIVKNEAANIERCLASARMAGVTVATIVDTGSTDGTQDLIRSALAYQPDPTSLPGWNGRGCPAGHVSEIPLTLVERPFVNMGHNRSEAFALARGTADWLIALDADMTVEIDADFVPDPAVEAYQIEMRDGGWSWRLPLLLRGDLSWKSTGAYHEWTGLDDGRAFVGAQTDAMRVHFPSTPTSAAKRHWQAGLLETDIAEHPDDARTLFYLAQTRKELGDPRARADYLRRVEMGGWDEERFWAQYHAANLAPDWPTRAIELMAAWESRPSRLEPLCDLLRELNRRGLHRTAYLLSNVPTTPTTDISFAEPAVYAWGITWERSIAAYWADHKEECRDLTDKLLAREDLPADVRAQAILNRGCCDA